MACKYFLLLLVMVTLVTLENVKCDDGEDEEMCPCILLSITEDSATCSDVDNNDYKMELKMNLKEGSEDEPDMMKMDGWVELVQDAEEGLEIWMEATMDTERGPELVFSCTSDLCQSMKDTDAPWFPIVKYFNTTGCPVPKKYYPIKGLLLDLSFANGILTHDFCGAYSIRILLKKAVDTVFCILLGAEIYEAQKPCSECPSKEAS